MFTHFSPRRICRNGVTGSKCVYIFSVVISPYRPPRGCADLYPHLLWWWQPLRHTLANRDIIKICASPLVWISISLWLSFTFRHHLRVEYIFVCLCIIWVSWEWLLSILPFSVAFLLLFLLFFLPIRNNFYIFCILAIHDLNVLWSSSSNLWLDFHFILSVFWLTKFLILMEVNLSLFSLYCTLLFVSR